METLNEAQQRDVETLVRLGTPARAFPHAGQTVGLAGVEVEVLHVDRGIAFWYNHKSKVHGVERVGLFTPSKRAKAIAELRDLLDEGLTAEQIVDLGWRCGS